MAPLETSELAHLLVRLEQGVAETGGRFKLHMTLVAGLFALMGVGMAIQASWAVAAFVWAFGAFLGWIGYKASTKNSPEKMRPAFEAVRDRPETISKIIHYTTSDSRRIFVTHWINIAAPGSHLLLKAPDWETLVPLLQRRCPNAEYIDR